MDQGHHTKNTGFLQSHRKRLLKQFLNGSRLPTLPDLQGEYECSICKEEYLTGDNPEVPVRLHCGHMVGSGCILKWLSPLSSKGRNSCVVCRKPVFSSWDSSDYSPAAPEITPIPEQSPVPEVPDLAPEEIWDQAVIYYHIWMQFQEGIVQAVEDLDNGMGDAQVAMAKKIIAMPTMTNYQKFKWDNLEAFRRIERTFPQLHRELLICQGEFRPIPGIIIESSVKIDVRDSVIRLMNANFARAIAWPRRLQIRMQGLRRTSSLARHSPEAEQQGDDTNGMPTTRGGRDMRMQPPDGSNSIGSSEGLGVEIALWRRAASTYLTPFGPQDDEEQL